MITATIMAKKQVPQEYDPAYESFLRSLEEAQEEGRSISIFPSAEREQPNENNKGDESEIVQPARTAKSKRGRKNQSAATSRAEDYVRVPINSSIYSKIRFAHMIYNGIFGMKNTVGEFILSAVDEYMKRKMPKDFDYKSHMPKGD